MSLDMFTERMNKARFLSSALMKLGKYVKDNGHKHTVTSDCGDIEFIVIPNHNVSIQICTNRSESFKASSRAAILYFQDIYSSNAVNTTSVFYSPLNKTCTVGNFTAYKIEYPFEHDEAKYFQNLTRYDLPEEHFYIEACKVLQEIKDFEIVSMEVFLSELRDDHMVAIDKLLHKMGLDNA